MNQHRKQQIKTLLRRNINTMRVKVKHLMWRAFNMIYIYLLTDSSITQQRKLDKSNLAFFT